MQREGASVLFSPRIDDFDGVSLRSFIIGWMHDFHDFPASMKRLCTGNGDYSVELESRPLLRDMVEDIHLLLVSNAEDCDNFAKTFSDFSDLWTLNLKESFDSWWKDTAVFPETASAEGEDAAPAEEGAEGEAAEEVVEELDDADKRPPIAAFEAKITEYTTLRDQCNLLPSTADIGWLRVDSKPVRTQLLYWTSQWVALYTDHVKNNILDSMAEMTSFMTQADTVLSQEVSEEEDDGSLRSVLECIRDVKKNSKRFDTMVQPLKEFTGLLKKFGVSIDDSVIEQMDSAPDKWDSVKHNMFSVKEQLNDLYNREGDKLKRRTMDFGKQISAFRQKFQAEAPFRYSVGMENAYGKLVEQQDQIVHYNTEICDLVEAQALYELVPSRFKEVSDSQKELILLKQCWDMGQLIVYTFQDWRRLLWNDIDTDYLAGEAKNLKDQVKKLDKKVRIWDTYKGIDDECGNMLTALPLVQQLKSPSMRQRHWKELMVVVGVSFTLDSAFCLEDLLKLELHRFEEDVEGVVIKSSKELTIEKNIAKIEGVWADLDMMYYVYPKDDTVQLMKVHSNMLNDWC